jgi:hypothetical protein
MQRRAAREGGGSATAVRATRASHGRAAAQAATGARVTFAVAPEGGAGADAGARSSGAAQSTTARGQTGSGGTQGGAAASDALATRRAAEKRAPQGDAEAGAAPPSAEEPTGVRAERIGAAPRAASVPRAAVHETMPADGAERDAPGAQSASAARSPTGDATGEATAPEAEAPGQGGDDHTGPEPRAGSGGAARAAASRRRTGGGGAQGGAAASDALAVRRAAETRAPQGDAEAGAARPSAGEPTGVRARRSSGAAPEAASVPRATAHETMPAADAERDAPGARSASATRSPTGDATVEATVPEAEAPGPGGDGHTGFEPHAGDRQVVPLDAPASAHGGAGRHAHEGRSATRRSGEPGARRASAAALDHRVERHRAEAPSATSAAHDSGSGGDEADEATEGGAEVRCPEGSRDDGIVRPRSLVPTSRPPLPCPSALTYDILLSALSPFPPPALFPPGAPVRRQRRRRPGACAPA